MTTPEIARRAFAKYGIDVSDVDDDAVVKAYNSIADAATATGGARAVSDLLCAVRALNDFTEQPRLDPKRNLDLNELLR